jgi:hypothetical protein
LADSRTGPQLSSQGKDLDPNLRGQELHILEVPKEFLLGIRELGPDPDPFLDLAGGTRYGVWNWYTEHGIMSSKRYVI